MIWKRLLLVTMAWLLLPSVGMAEESQCRNARVNAKGIAGAPIVVSATLVVIFDYNSSRCGVRILNESLNDARCGPTTGDYALIPSSTVGYLIPKSSSQTSASGAFGREVQQSWGCVRVGASDAVLSIMEELP